MSRQKILVMIYFMLKLRYISGVDPENENSKNKRKVKGIWLKKQVKRMMRTLLSCTLAVSMYLPCTNVYATDTVDNLEKKTNELSSELSKVNEELSTLSSELDSTISKVESTTNAIELTKVSLADAQAKEVQQYSDMKLRIKYIYEAGDLSF